MIILITGTPGSGKTLYAVHRIVQWVEQGRTVYSDIDGLNIPEVQPIPNGDWQQTPPGSVVVYDEAQRNPFFQYKGKEKLSSHKIISELETARHDGYDIVFITQSPKFLHLHLLELVGEHYHVNRPFGRKQAEVALHRKVSMMPNTVAAMERAEDVFKFKYDPALFDLYKSAEIHTHKTRVPKFMFKLGSIALAGLLFIGYIVFGKENQYLRPDTYLGKPQPSSVPQQQQKPVVYDPLTPEQRADLQHQSQQVQQSQQQLVTYDYKNPYATDYAASNIPVAEPPRFAGCIATPTNCKCYTQQGTLIDTDAKICNRAVTDGLPYNPYRQPQQQMQPAIVQTQPALQTQTPA